MTTAQATDWEITADYLKNCNCIATCPCDTEGVPFPHKGCEGMMAMNIISGHFGDVKLDGAKVAGVVSWPGPIHEGNGTMQPILDENTSDAQREALGAIMSGQAGNPLFQIMSQMCPNVLEPIIAPIAFEFDMKGRRAKVSVPGVLETETAPLTIPATGDEQRVVVNMPDGFEYKTMEVARAVTLKSTGGVKFEHANTHSSLARVTHSPEGVR